MDEKIYNTIKAIYTYNKVYVRINNRLCTDWFNVPNGVRQGDPLSTNLFNIFINDLAKYLNLLNIGIDINGTIICIL